MVVGSDVSSRGWKKPGALMQTVEQNEGLLCRAFLLPKMNEVFGMSGRFKILRLLQLSALTCASHWRSVGKVGAMMHCSFAGKR